MFIKLNKSHLNHTVMLKILKGIRKALSSTNGYTFVNNRKSQPIIKIEKVVKDKKVSFRIIDLQGNNLYSAIVSNFVPTRSTKLWDQYSVKCPLNNGLSTFIKRNLVTN